MRIALGLEYDGSAYCGWQTQLSGCAVQNAVEAALAQIAGHTVGVVCAGRTDAGVHALGQVAHFDAAAERPLSAWVRGVNALLPDSVAVRWAQLVDHEFHARFSAIGRRYRYVLLNRAVRPALHRHKVGWHHVPLELEAMRMAAQYLIGEHDFSAFRAAECQAHSPVRQLRRIEIVRHGDFLILDFDANAFLHHMVRNIVGCLVYVGDGRQPPQWLHELLQNRDRRLSAPTFSPAGLYLTGVDYGERWQFPARQDDWLFP